MLVAQWIDILINRKITALFTLATKINTSWGPAGDKKISLWPALLAAAVQMSSKFVPKRCCKQWFSRASNSLWGPSMSCPFIRYPGMQNSQWTQLCWSDIKQLILQYREAFFIKKKSRKKVVWKLVQKKKEFKNQNKSSPKLKESWGKN